MGRFGKLPVKPNTVERYKKTAWQSFSMKINLTSLKFKELPETVIPSLKHLHEPIEPIERMKLNDEEQKIWEKLLREHIKTTQRCSGDEYMK